VELDEAILYRMAYGLAADLAEACEHRLAGPHALNPAAGGTLEQITAEVLRRLAVADDAEREIAREAVEDALEKRRPKW
jgi:hypothetical protein